MAELINKNDNLNDGRKKLNNAIKAFNETVVEGDSSVEAAQARVDGQGHAYGTLKQRLDEEHNQVSSQLAQKVSKGNVSVNDINKNLGKLDQTYMSDEFLQQMAGETSVYSTPKNLSVTNEKIANKAVSIDKTDFIVKSSNHADTSQVVHGKIVSSVTGELADGLEYNTSTEKYIPIHPNTTYTSAYMTHLVYYDEQHNFLTNESVSGGTRTWTTPENAHFVRFTFSEHRLDEVQLNVGNQLLPYEKYYERLDENLKLFKETNDIQLVYDGTSLRQVKEGETTTELNYDDKGMLVSVTETDNAQTIQSTLIFENGVLSTVQREKKGAS